MLNYTKTEFFRLKKSFVTYLFPLLGMLVIVLMIFVTKKGDMLTGEMLDTSNPVQMVIGLMIQVAPFAIAWVVDLFYENEFKKKTVGRPIEAGYSRETVFSGKLLGIYLHGFASVFVTLLFAWVTFTIFFQYSPDWTRILPALKYLGLVLLALTFFIALYILLSITTENALGKFALYCFFLTFHKLGKLLFELLGLQKGMNLLKYWPGAVASDLTKAVTLKLGVFGPLDESAVKLLMSNFTIRFGISFALGIILMIVALIYFKKKGNLA